MSMYELFVVVISETLLYSILVWPRDVYLCHYQQSAVQVTVDFVGCSLLKKYYSQLHFVQSRFPLGDGDSVVIPFTWWLIVAFLLHYIKHWQCTFVWESIDCALHWEGNYRTSNSALAEPNWCNFYHSQKHYVKFLHTGQKAVSFSQKPRF